MRIKRFIIWLTSLSLLLTLVACNLPSGNQSSATTPDLNGTVAAEVAIAQAAQTMVAQTLTAAAQAQPLVSTPTNTLEAPPDMTFTPTLTSTITTTPTPEGVTLVLTNDTYCRVGGPYSSFKIVATVKAGQKVEVLSRNPENDSYYVINPYDTNSRCWLYGKYATVTGDTAILPVSTMQATPTPTATPTPNSKFTVTYIGLETCAPLYAFKLLIKNTGGTIWQYEQITGSDSVTAFIINHSSNVFTEYVGCAGGLTQADLAPGEESYVLNVNPGHFGYDPTGHLINITVKLCSEDGGAGTCLSQNLSFTP